MKKGFFLFILDAIILIISFYFLLFLKYNTLKVISSVDRTTVYFLILWLFISISTGKYNGDRLKSFREVISALAFSNLVILGLSVILIRISKPFIDFRFIILYTIFVATGLELFFGYFYVLIYKAIKSPFFPEKFNDGEAKGRNTKDVVYQENQVITKEKEIHAEFESLIDLNAIITEETDQDTFNFIRNYFSPKKLDTLIISTTTVFNLYNQPRSKYEVIINLKRINDIQYINKFFEAVNSKLNFGGLFLDWVETYSQRKERILGKYPWGVNYLIYTLDFIFKRVFPKLKLTKKIYFFITRGNNRVLSKAETFGRLYSCGFEIVEEQFINNRLFFVFRKIKEPLFDYHPTYGPIVKLQRIGKNGQIIGVFKMRTMHAYSEYLQDYIYKKHNLEEGGKFKNDFRVTTLGKIFRALWIDEFPMLINVVLLRNMKVVGVRPLSEHYFNLYSEYMKQKRIKWKPGLIPPYYAQYPTPKTLDQIQENEMKYLLEYEKNPIITDFRYFFKALYNIIFHQARSK
jgi:lipopolysaccharide/colanic/teichoic acid biosynthesis glycosyltransferase